MFRTILICFVLAGIAMPLPLSAQQPPSATQQTQNIKRTPLQKFDVTVIGLAEIVPNVNIGRHTHPGPESGFMLEGDFVLLVEGQAPLPVKAGESYKVPPGAVHDARTGANGAKVIATYVVEKGKPLATSAP